MRSQSLDFGWSGRRSRGNGRGGGLWRSFAVVEVLD